MNISFTLLLAAALLLPLPTSASSSLSQLASQLQESILEQVQADDVELSTLHYSNVIPKMDTNALADISSSDYTPDITTLAVQLANKQFTADITLAPTDSETDSISFTVSGRYQPMMSIPVIDKMVQRGEAIDEGAITFQLLPENRVRHYHVTHAKQLLGKVATRRLTAHRAISTRDIQTPDMVTKGDKVHAFYRTQNMQVATLVDVLESGAAGDIISVRNLDSGASLKVHVNDLGELLVMTSANRPPLQLSQQ